MPASQPSYTTHHQPHIRTPQGSVKVIDQHYGRNMPAADLGEPAIPSNPSSSNNRTNDSSNSNSNGSNHNDNDGKQPGDSERHKTALQTNGNNPDTSAAHQSKPPASPHRKATTKELNDAERDGPSPQLRPVGSASPKVKNLDGSEKSSSSVVITGHEVCDHPHHDDGRDVPQGTAQADYHPQSAAQHDDLQHSHGEKPLTIVLKVGSSSLSTPDGNFLHMTNIVRLVDTIMSLKEKGHNVILITSGAVSVGCLRMDLPRPTNLITKQAVAAVGQSRLMRVYDDMFGYRKQTIAQILLSRENLSKLHQYNNAQNTFHELLRLGVVPVVNENDTVAVEELRFGDNDTISALVGSLVEADWLFLLTDVDALYSADPRTDPDAKPVHVVHDIEKLSVSIGEAGSWGTGGMATKIQAARIATTAGVTCGIIRSDKLENIEKMIAGEAVGTKFVPCSVPIRGKKRWIAHGCAPQGSITIDDGAKEAILKKKSLFAVGITAVESDFYAHSSVIVYDKNHNEVARGMVNYSSDEIHQVKGLPSRKYAEKLGYGGPNEIINRENLALTIPSAHFPINEPALGASPTSNAVKCANHGDLPPFQLVREFNPGTSHAVAEYRSVNEDAKVQLVTLQHLDTGITGHGSGSKYDNRMLLELVIIRCHVC